MHLYVLYTYSRMENLLWLRGQKLQCLQCYVSVRFHLCQFCLADLVTMIGL